MAGEGELRTSTKGSEDDLPILNAENLQSNIKSVYYSRTFLSIIGGVVAGIWGFTGLTGFIVYFLVMAAASLGLAAKAKFSVNKYFDSWNRILLDGTFGGLMSFVLSWAYPYFTGDSNILPSICTKMLVFFSCFSFLCIYFSIPFI